MRNFYVRALALLIAILTFPTALAIDTQKSLNTENNKNCAKLKVEMQVTSKTNPMTTHAEIAFQIMGDTRVLPLSQSSTK